MNAYLLEIGLEEMPADVIVPSAQQLAEKIRTTCQQNQITFESLQIFSSPTTPGRFSKRTARQAARPVLGDQRPSRAYCQGRKR